MPANGRRVPPFGHPRISGCLPPPRGFSQAAAPFVASCRLGIHRMRFFAWPCNPNRPGRGRAAAPKGAGQPSRFPLLHYPRGRRAPSGAFRPRSCVSQIVKELQPPPRGRPASGPLGPACGSPLGVRVWWSQGGSNSRPPACKAGALPAELWPPGVRPRPSAGGSGRSRTSDLTLIRGAL